MGILLTGEQSVIWVAGAAAPPEESFRECIDAVGHRVRSIPKGLELFASSRPIPSYSLTTEVDGVVLAAALQQPQRVASIAVDKHIIGHHFGVQDEERFWAGPWQDAKSTKKGVTPYPDELVDCLSDAAQYIYDTNYQSGAYLETHARHMEHWHG